VAPMASETSTWRNRLCSSLVRGLLLAQSPTRKMNVAVAAVVNMPPTLSWLRYGHIVHLMLLAE